MGTFLSLLYFFVFLFAGFVLAKQTTAEPDAALLSALTVSYAVALLAALPAVFALIFGFRLIAVVLAGIAAALISGGGVMRSLQMRNKIFRTDFTPAAFRCPKQSHWFWICVLPLFFWTCELLVTHTLRPDGAGGYLCGQSTFGDLPMHLSFIRYIAESGSFPPSYPLLAGDVPMGYPFLCESISSVFLILGASLRIACLLPQFAAVYSVFSFVFLLARQMLQSAAKAAMSFVLFFLGSGLGIFYFLGSKEQFLSIFTGYYTTPTNYTAKNIVWVNPIADLLIVQRATLFGWCILFCCLFLLWRFAFEGERRYFLPLGLLGGLLPLLHTHSFLALVLCSGVLFIRAVYRAYHGRQALRFWLYYAGIAAALSLPQVLMFTLLQAAGEHFLHFYTNWINHGKDPYLWFYLKNIGLVWLLLIPAFFHAKSKQRWFYAGGAVIWALCEMIVFQPNPYDNNKLLFVWHLLGCILVGQLLCDLFYCIRSKPLRRLACGVVLLLVCSGSILTLMREQKADMSSLPPSRSARRNGRCKARRPTPYF